MTKLTREWVAKADADHRLAKHAFASKEPFPDHVCFLCQQSAEKYLKALLQEAGVAVPRTHLLLNLIALVLPVHPSFRSLQRGLKFLTRFAVDARYPGLRASKRQAASAMRWVEKVRAAARTILGLPLRTRGKHR